MDRGAGIGLRRIRSDQLQLDVSVEDVLPGRASGVARKRAKEQIEIARHVSHAMES